MPSSATLLRDDHDTKQGIQQDFYARKAAAEENRRRVEADLGRGCVDVAPRADQPQASYEMWSLNIRILGQLVASVHWQKVGYVDGREGH